MFNTFQLETESAQIVTKEGESIVCLDMLSMMIEMDIDAFYIENGNHYPIIDVSPTERFANKLVESNPDVRICDRTLTHNVFIIADNQACEIAQ